MEKSAAELIASLDETLWRKGLSLLTEERTEHSFNLIYGILQDRLWKKRESAAQALIAWGNSVVPYILAKFPSPKNLDQLYWSLNILGHFDDPAAKEKILEHLRSSNPEIRGYAVRAISIKPSKENARQLFPLLNDSNWGVRKLVFSHLLSFGEILLDDIRNLLIQSKDDPIHSLVALFVKIGREKISEDLKVFFSEGSFSFKYSIILALGEDDSPSSIDFLTRALSDSSFIIRKKAAEILTGFGTKVFDRLSMWFGKGDLVMKNQIIGILVDIFGERALPILRRLLTSPEEEIRIMAIEHLTKIPSDDASKLILKCFGDPKRIVADYASDCLARKEKLNFDLLLENLRTDDENIRFLVIKTIGSIGGIALNPILRILREGTKEEKLFLLGVLQKITPNEIIIDTLISLLNDENWPIRNGAATCLKSYGEKAVGAVVKVLNSPSEDVQFWARKVLLSMGGNAIKTLREILEEGSNLPLIPHIIAALLAMDHPEAVPAVLGFIENHDDLQIQSVFEAISEISSREVVENLLNLLSHPDDRIVGWLSNLLRKIRNSNLRRIVLLGVNHSDERARFFVLDAISYWNSLSEQEVKVILRQVNLEKIPKNIECLFKILAKVPSQSVIESLKEFLRHCDPNLMLDLMLILASSENSEFETMLADLLSIRSEVIRIEDVERVGKILGLIFKSRPEGILQGLSSTNMVFRLCCVVALEQIRENRVAFALMENLNIHDDPAIVKRAAKILVNYFFSEDFRLRGAVMDFFLNLGKIIVEPLSEVLPNIENEIERKSIIDLIESVGGKVEDKFLRKKGEKKVILSDSRLDDVLERRKKAMEELEKYDQIIQATHTQNLTIMFTDVKGYTAFSSKASLSEVMGMLKEHDDLLIPIIEKHSGKLLKKIGDAFLVIFEKENDSLLAAIEIQRKLKEHNTEVPEDRRLGIRIAINSGPVVRRENDVFGETVNLASRLEGVADAEEIVISESVLEKINRQVFDISEYGVHQLKGIDKPVKVYKVAW